MKKVKDGRYKGQPPLIAQARNDPLATTFAAVALLNLPLEEEWYVESHKALTLKQGAVEEQPAFDLRNTLCSLLEAAFIAAMGTCQHENGYLRKWQAEFGNAMGDINEANADNAIKGNFAATRHLRDFVRDEKVPLRGGAFLERIGSEIFYQGGQRESVLVGGCDSLKSFLKGHFEKHKTMEQPLLAAQVDSAMVKAGSQAAGFRQLFETLRRGTYSVPFTYTGMGIGAPVIVPGARASTGRSVMYNVTVPSVDLPQAIRDGTDPASLYRVFLWRKGPEMRYYIKKELAVTERPDRNLFRVLGFLVSPSTRYWTA